jgi:hypothetical protein
MTEPCTAEQLQASCATLRALAIAAGRRLELARVEGAKMRQIWVLENESRAAWLRFYSVSNRADSARLHEAIAS